MTPQEKSKELVSKNFDVLAKASGYKGLKKEGADKFYALEKVAKKFALITVDEMISEFTDCYSSDPDDLNAIRLSFWMDVKQELEKL